MQHGPLPLHHLQHPVPTFHPKFQPPTELKCLATCPIEVETWEEPAEADIPTNSLMAPYCRGERTRCATQLAQVLEEMKADPLQHKKVVVFSASTGVPRHSRHVLDAGAFVARVRVHKYKWRLATGTGSRDA